MRHDAGSPLVAVWAECFDLSGRSLIKRGLVRRGLVLDLSGLDLNVEGWDLFRARRVRPQDTSDWRRGTGAVRDRRWGESVDLALRLAKAGRSEGHEPLATIVWRLLV